MIELLVTISIFGIASTAFYGVMLSGTRGSNSARDVARVSEEARLGLNRMVRDTREGSNLIAASSSSYTVRVDFDSDGIFENPNGSGDDEILTFAYEAGAIKLNGDMLVEGVSAMGSRPVFHYSSSVLDFDANGDGVTTVAELEQAATTNPSIGNPLSFVTTVNYAFKVTSGRSSTDFFGKAQLRNSLK